MIIYLLTNKINNKKYIGKTVTPINIRWNVHKCNAKTRAKYPISLAIKKYGPENFTIETLSTYQNLTDLNNAEIAAIALYKTTDKTIGYNLDPGGSGAPIGNQYMKGHQHTQDSRSKMSISHTGLKLGPASSSRREKISKALTGIVRGPMSTTHKKAISSGLKGKKHTPEHVKKVKEASKWYKPTDEIKKRISETLKQYHQQKKLCT